MGQRTRSFQVNEDQLANIAELKSMLSASCENYPVSYCLRAMAILSIEMIDHLREIGQINEASETDAIVRAVNCMFQEGRALRPVIQKYFE